MLFHASIPARQPEHVARVIAELWNGQATPFPPCPGGWIALAGDDRNSAVECYPQDTVMEPGVGDEMTQFVPNPPSSRVSAFHLAIATPLSEAEVHAIAARESWRSVRCTRGRGMFDVIEFWLENALMVEVLTAEMQADYLNNFTMAKWSAMLAAGAPAELPLAA
jgi:hypothetical protein